MKNIKVRNLISVIVISVMVFGIFALPVLSDDYKVYAASKVKVTFNANGGKIDKAAKKVVNMTKGKKIGKKLPAASKMIRSGYTFKGWYTKKSGGKKITKNTKIKKKATYYAHWKKGTADTSINKKIIGKWEFVPPQNYYYFKSNGSFQYIWTNISFYPIYTTVVTGKWSIKNGKIYLTDLVDDSDKKLKNLIYTCSYGTDALGDYLLIPQPDLIPADSANEPSHSPVEFRRSS